MHLADDIPLTSDGRGIKFHFHGIRSRATGMQRARTDDADNFRLLRERVAWVADFGKVQPELSGLILHARIDHVDGEIVYDGRPYHAASTTRRHGKVVARYCAVLVAAHVDDELVFVVVGVDVRG